MSFVQRQWIEAPHIHIPPDCRFSVEIFGKVYPDCVPLQCGYPHLSAFLNPQDISTINPNQPFSETSIVYSSCIYIYMHIFCMCVYTFHQPEIWSLNGRVTATFTMIYLEMSRHLGSDSKPFLKGDIQHHFLLYPFYSSPNKCHCHGDILRIYPQWI